jgi:hypothetical protein
MVGLTWIAYALKPRLRSVFSASASGFGEGSFRKWTREKSAPSLELLRLLSERLHGSVDWILRRERTSQSWRALHE